MSDDLPETLWLPAKPHWSIGPYPPIGDIIFHAGQQELFRIKPNGAIERGPAFTTEDVASLRLWTAIAEAFPLAKAGWMGRAEVTEKAHAAAREIAALVARYTEAPLPGGFVQLTAKIQVIVRDAMIEVTNAPL